jgi:dTDP-4-dehydrorhamnose 3,5-epimerase
MNDPIKIEELGLKGVFLITPSKFQDERGGFYKNFDENLLQNKGLKPHFSEEFFTTSKRGVIRGLHYQCGRHSQAKFIWCFKGKVFDVVVDLRKSSPTFGRWISVELSEENKRTLYIPRGMAHGFLALSDEASLLYKMDNPYSPADERGINYKDPELAICWPVLEVPHLLSAKDKNWGSFAACEKFD